MSPDGKWIAFVSKRGDDAESQVYVIAVDGGEARRVTNIPTGASVPKWFPDSRHIAFVSEIWSDLVRWEDQAARKKERADSKMTAKVWTKAPISYFDHYLDDREPHLFSIGVDGGDVTAITRMSGFHLSKQEIDAYLVRHFARRSRSGLHGQRRRHRHRRQLRRDRAARLRLQAAAQHHRGQQVR